MLQNDKSKSPGFFLVTGFILVAATTRFFPPMPNFSPVGAIALFAGACFATRQTALLVPMAVFLVSDIALNTTQYADWGAKAWGLSLFSYVALAAIVCIGFKLKDRTRNIAALTGGAFGASIVFFLISNFAWFVMYHPWTMSELIVCYTNAIPFFKWTLLSDASYTAALFGVLALVENMTRVEAKSHLASVEVQDSEV